MGKTEQQKAERRPKYARDYEIIPCRICLGTGKNPSNGEACARCDGFGEEYVQAKKG